MVTHAFCWFFHFINKASYYQSKDSFKPLQSHTTLLRRESTAVLKNENWSRLSIIRYSTARSFLNCCSYFLWFNVCLCACVCVCVYAVLHAAIINYIGTSALHITGCGSVKETRHRPTRDASRINCDEVGWSYTDNDLMVKQGIINFGIVRWRGHQDSSLKALLKSIIKIVTNQFFVF